MSKCTRFDYYFWGLGIGPIGDWAQSPIPNPQSPIPEFLAIAYM